MTIPKTGNVGYIRYFGPRRKGGGGEVLDFRVRMGDFQVVEEEGTHKAGRFWPGHRDTRDTGI